MQGFLLLVGEYSLSLKFSLPSGISLTVFSIEDWKRPELLWGQRQVVSRCESHGHGSKHWGYTSEWRSEGSAPAAAVSQSDSNTNDGNTRRQLTLLHQIYQIYFDPTINPSSDSNRVVLFFALFNCSLISIEKCWWSLLLLTKRIWIKSYTMGGKACG